MFSADVCKRGEYFRLYLFVGRLFCQVKGVAKHFLGFWEAPKERKNIALQLGHADDNIGFQIRRFNLLNQTKQFHVTLRNQLPAFFDDEG